MRVRDEVSPIRGPHLDPNDFCIVWGGTIAQHGYGRIDRKINRKTHSQYVHRLITNAPPEMTVDHLCRNRACFRIDHLEIVTNDENLNRGLGRHGSDPICSKCGSRDFWISPSTGWKKCRPCKLAKDRVRIREFYQRHPEKYEAVKEKNRLRMRAKTAAARAKRQAA